MTSTIELLQQGDHDLFLLINGLHAPWLDTLMYWITLKYTWIPMYIVLIWVTFKSEKRKAFAIMAAVLAAVIIADKITSGIMKPYFLRLRPCHEPTLDGLIHEVTGCGGMYGFASSHASTSFALATTWFVLLKDKVKYMGWLIFWAALYSYSRVYVGAHYPGDIFIGGIIGALTGALCVQLHNTFLKKYYHN